MLILNKFCNHSIPAFFLAFFLREGHTSLPPAILFPRLFRKLLDHIFSHFHKMKCRENVWGWSMQRES